MLITKSKSKLSEEIKTTYATYLSKFYSYWMGKFKIEELSDECNHFIFKQIWNEGSVLLFPFPNRKEEDTDIDSVIATPYASSTTNIYNFPTFVQAINLRDFEAIPKTQLKVNKDCVILFGHVSHSSIRSMVEFYLNRIVEIEMVISTHLFNQKLPRLVAVSPEDRSRVESLMNAIERGEKKLFIDINDIQSINNVLQSGGEYVIDKLYLYKENLVNELLTYMGIDNKGVNKAERNVVDEVNANNQSIIESGDNFKNELQKGLENANRYLNITLTLQEFHPTQEMVEDVSKGDSKDENKQDTDSI